MIKKIPHLHWANTWQIMLVVLVCLLAIIIAASIRVLPSPYAPMLVLTGILSILFVFTWLKRPVWALYAAIFVVLLPTGIIPDQFHSLLNRALTVIALILCLIHLYKNHLPVVLSSTTVLMALFVGWCVITLFWTPNLTLSITILQSYLLRLILFLFIIPNMIRSQKELSGLMNALAMNGWVLVFTALVTYIVLGYTPGTRFKVLDVNSNKEGMAIILAMMGVLWQASQTTAQKIRLNRLFAGIYLILTIAFVAISASRGSALSLAITLAFFWLWPSTRPWGKLGLAILLLSALLSPFMFTTLIGRLSGSAGDPLLGGRAELWQASWRLILDHPWTGVGIGLSLYEVVPYLRKMNFFVSLLGLDGAPIHNPLLLIWAEMGLPAIALYIGVLASALMIFFKQYRIYRGITHSNLNLYFALIISILAGFSASWFKGGGSERDPAFYFMLSLLLLSSNLVKETDKTLTQQP